MARCPVLFVSHGMPNIALNPGRIGGFWQQLGREMERPRAIICISAHLEATRPLVTTDPYPDTIHDFAGFPRALYEIRYPAPGDPDLAQHLITATDTQDMAALRGIGGDLVTPAFFNQPLKIKAGIF